MSSLTRTIAAAALAAAALAPAASDAASPTPGAIGGYANGPIAPVPRGGPRIPYSARFLAGRPRILNLRVQRIVGGAQAGRLQAVATVSYPRLQAQWKGLISDKANYAGRLLVVLKSSRGSGHAVGARNLRALPVRPDRSGGRVIQRALLSKSASRRLRAAGGPLVIGTRAVASFDQFGDGRYDATPAASLRRTLRISSAPRAASGQEHPYPCSADADLHSYAPSSPDLKFVHRVYGPSLEVFMHVGEPSVRIRLCVWSGQPLGGVNWVPYDGADFPLRTKSGTMTEPRVEDGYVTVTYTPDRGIDGGGPDEVKFLGGYDRTGAPGPDYDLFDVRMIFRPFEMRAVGDSITAGWGYLGNGDPPQLSGSDQDFDVAQLKRCEPTEGGPYSNRCSSNSDAGPSSSDNDSDHRFKDDTGLGNNVSWAAQFANRHGIGRRSPNGQYQTFGNYAVSGARPVHYIEKPRDSRDPEIGRLAYILRDYVANYDPDLTVMTLGANPLLAKVLLEGKYEEVCGGGRTGLSAKQRYERAGTCMRVLMGTGPEGEDVYGRLRAIYRRLLDSPDNHIFVATYPVSYPGSLNYLAVTKNFVNDYPAFVIERLSSALNAEIVRAVHDEAALARSQGKGDRLFVFSPPRFNIGLPGLAQAVFEQSGLSCGGLTVDGRSQQSAETQKRVPRICGGSDYFFESLDGGLHLSKTGATQYANALDAAIREHGVQVPFAGNQYSARYVDESYPQSPLHPGQTGTVKFTFKNTGAATLYRTGTNPTNCRASHPIDRQSAWLSTPGVPIDQAVVQPGENFTCTLQVKAPQQTGTYNEYFSPVTEGKAWMFNNGNDDVFVPLTSS